MYDYSQIGPAVAAIGIILLIILLVVVIPIWIFSVIVYWKMFKKAGKPGWAALIPIYNKFVLFDIIGYKWYYALIYFGLIFLSLISKYLIAAAFAIYSLSYSIKLSKCFKQDVLFGIGLWIFNPIFVAVIAFNKNIEYSGPSVDGDINFNDLF